MKIEQLIKDIQTEQPKALSGLSEAAAAKLLRTAFKVVHKAIAEATEGAVGVPGLGNFKVRQHKSKEEEGAESVRRIHFTLASTEKRDPDQPKVPKAAKGEGLSEAEREAKRAERQAARKTAGKGEGKAGGKRTKAAANDGGAAE